MLSDSLRDVPPLAVPHHIQAGPSDCLAACAAMVLAYYGRSTPNGRLLHLLNIGPFGAPRRNILSLSRLRGVTVAYREATLPIAAQYLQTGMPVIAFVDTGELAYWSITTNHALVLVGIAGDNILANDPAMKDSPVRIPVWEFDLGWLNAGNACAIVSVRG